MSDISQEKSRLTALRFVMLEMLMQVRLETLLRALES